MRNCVFLLSMILIFGQISFAQNYQTFNSGRTAFFEDETKSVAAIRIDSVSVDTDSILFPMRIILPNDEFCLSPNFSSWVGPKIIIKPNSENLFFNSHGDTITIKTNAVLNETWTFYKSEKIIVMAEVTEWDTEAFLGVEDNVKTISFQAYDGAMNTVEHRINEDQLHLSENYGLLSVINFYLFPETDFEYYIEFLPRFYLNIIGMTNPEMGFRNLTMYRVFDFQPGDELHILEKQEENSGKVFQRKTILKYLERTDFSDSIVYKVERLSYYQNFQSDSTHYLKDTFISIIKPDDNFDRLPAELNRDNLYSEIWSIKNNEFISKTNTTDNFPFYYISDDCWGLSHVDGGSYHQYYLDGRGGMYFYNYSDYGVFWNMHSKSLVYSKKGEETWGTPLTITTSVNEAARTRFPVYPNPANNHIKIYSETAQPLMVEIFELTGKLIDTREIQPNEGFDISSLSNGVYLIRITDGERNSFINKLVKQ